MRKPFRVTKDMRSDDPIKAAQAYTDADQPVVVTHGLNDDNSCTCGNPDCHSPGKHPISKYFPQGVKSATTDMQRIKRAFKKYPNANLGIALKNLTVADIDGQAGAEAIDDLNLPETATVLTRRGRHEYYLNESKSGTFKAEKLDILTGTARYVIAPPSFYVEGQYEWDEECPFELAIVPEALESLRPVKPPPKSDRAATDFKIKDGERNDTLFKLARDLRRRGVSERVLKKTLAFLNNKACEKPLPRIELKTLIQSSANYVEDPTTLFGPPSITEPLPHEFLWYPYIPKFGVTILAGDPGMGKSLLLALFVGIVTGGQCWPLSKERPKEPRVLLLSAEDNWARVTLARLKKAGAIVDNINIMQKFKTLDNKCLEAMLEAMKSWRPTLVLIDTLSAYMGGARDMHRQNEVGEFLAVLNEYAEEIGCAIVGLAHLNKQSGDNPLYRIVGSIGFAASIRSAVFLGKDPDNEELIAMAHGKSNGSILGPTILFKKAGGGRDDVPILLPVGFSDADASDICQVHKRPVGNPGGEREAARQFVLEYLSKKPKPWIAVQRACKARSLASEGTLNLLRAEMAKAGEIRQIGKGPKAKWVIGDAAKEDE